MNNRFLSACLVVLFIVICFQKVRAADNPPFFSKEAEYWADSIIKKLNREERIAQLMMVAAWSNKDTDHIKEISGLIEKYGIGGLIFFQGGPIREAILTNNYQSK